MCPSTGSRPESQQDLCGFGGSQRCKLQISRWNARDGCDLLDAERFSRDVASEEQRSIQLVLGVHLRPRKAGSISRLRHLSSC